MGNSFSVRSLWYSTGLMHELFGCLCFALSAQILKSRQQVKQCEQTSHKLQMCRDKADLSDKDKSVSVLT